MVDYAFNETFEGYDVGEEPYVPVTTGPPARITDLRVRSGNRALGPAELGLQGSSALVTDLELPIIVSGWAWCETRTPSEEDPSITPDLYFVAPASTGDGIIYSELSFIDVAGIGQWPLQGRFYHTADTSLLFAGPQPSPSVYPGPGWYRFVMSAVDGDDIFEVQFRAQIYTESGDLLFDNIFDVHADDIGTWRVGVDVPYGSAWDDFGARRYIPLRKWPRKDQYGHSTAVRKYPPMPRNRLVGGHP